MIRYWVFSPGYWGIWGHLVYWGGYPCWGIWGHLGYRVLKSKYPVLSIHRDTRYPRMPSNSSTGVSTPIPDTPNALKFLKSWMRVRASARCLVVVYSSRDLKCPQIPQYWWSTPMEWITLSSAGPSMAVGIRLSIPRVLVLWHHSHSFNLNLYYKQTRTTIQGRQTNNNVQVNLVRIQFNSLSTIKDLRISEYRSQLFETLSFYMLDTFDNNCINKQLLPVINLMREDIESKGYYNTQNDRLTNACFFSFRKEKKKWKKPLIILKNPLLSTNKGNNHFE